MQETSTLRFRIGPKAIYCPHCASTAVRRSRRKNFFERSLCRLLFLYPYRCQKCDARYFVLGRPLPQAEASPSNSPQTL
jgi:DNA-directed RNA polymerase subunit RPC12/RpoP